MPELKCTVQTCTYNQDFLCNLDAIKVGGDNAKAPEETCCGSFKERKDDGSYSNSTGEPSERCSIDCEATDCGYNDRCKCHAGKISVEGSTANQSEETACATFTCRG